MRGIEVCFPPAVLLDPVAQVTPAHFFGSASTCSARVVMAVVTRRSACVGSSSRESAQPVEDVAALLRRLIPDAPVPHAGMSPATLSFLMETVADKKVALERDLRGLKNVLSWLHRYERRAQCQDLSALFGEAAQMEVEQEVELPVYSAPSPDELRLLRAGGDDPVTATSVTAAPPAASSSCGALVAAVDVPVAAGGECPVDAAPLPFAPSVTSRGDGAARSRSASRLAARRPAGAARPELGTAGGSKKLCPADRCKACFNEERGKARSFGHSRGSDGRVCRLQPKGCGRGAGLATLPSGPLTARAASPATVSPKSSSSSSSESGV